MLTHCTHILIAILEKFRIHKRRFLHVSKSAFKMHYTFVTIGIKLQERIPGKIYNKDTTLPDFTIFIHSLVFSPRGRVGRKQSPVM